MTGFWRPLNENHAIEVMAVAIRFAQPLPDVAFRKALKALEGPAVALGLSERQVLGSGMPHGLPGITIQIEPLPGMPTAGQLFTSSTWPIDGPPKIVEQIQFDTFSLIYRTWNYVSWQWHRDRITQVFKDCLAIVADTVELQQYRMEYLDRFIFNGDPNEALPELLLRTDSELLPSHIFRKRDLWHAYTGHFLSRNPTFDRVSIINLDALEQPKTSPVSTVTTPNGAPNAVAMERFINIRTLVEDRLKPFESGQRDIAEALAAFGEMHRYLKKYLAEVINQEAVNKISLWEGGAQ